MTSFAILLMLIGIFVVLNSGNFTNIIFGKVQLNFVNPKSVP